MTVRNQVQSFLLAATSLVTGIIFSSTVLHSEEVRSYIVQLKPGIIQAEAFESEVGISSKIQYTEIFNGFATSLSPTDVEKLSKDPRVDEIIADEDVFLNEAQEDATGGLSRIDQRALPVDKTYHYNKTGNGVNVYILDSGVFSQHQEFEGRAQIISNVAEDGRDEDCIGHGTHVAGVIGGKTFGVAKKAKLLSVRVFPCGGRGKLSILLAGLDWLAKNYKAPAVLNLSIGMTPKDVVDKAISALITKGLTVVGSAGNNGQDACSQSPARIPEVITVGATDRRDALADFSNYGPCVKIYAPGVDIESSFLGDISSTKSMSGTSMAAPFVTGVVALLLEQFPTATPAEIRQKLTDLSTKGVVSRVRGEHNDLVFTGVAE